MNRSRRIISLTASVLISLGLIYYAVQELDWQTVRNTFLHLQWNWMLAALAVFFTSYLLRTLRFRALIHDQTPSFYHLMGVTLLHGMFNYLLPARTGEFSYPILLKRISHIKMPDSTATLLAARFFDFAIIVLALPILLVVFWNSLPIHISRAIIVFCAIFVLLGLSFVLLINRHNPQNNKQEKADKLPNRWLQQLVRLWHELIQGLQTIVNRKQHLRFILFTLGIWICVYTYFYFIVMSMGFETTYLQMVAVSMLMIPLTLLPINGLANIGAHEAAWTTAFLLFDFGRDTSLSIAVGSHIILLAFVLITGGLGSLILLFSHYIDTHS